MNTSGRTEPEGDTALTKGANSNSLEQVREILFGSLHRELGRRLARAEANLATQKEELRSEVRRRLEVLEAYMRRECEALSSSIEAQRSTQLDALTTAARESRDAVGLLELRVKRLEDMMTRTQRDFRQQILDQGNSFIDEVQRVTASLSAELSREAASAFSDTDEAGALAKPTADEPDRSNADIGSAEAA